MSKSFKREINPVLEIIGRDYEEVREVSIGEIKTGEPFENLFAIKREIFDAILGSIKEHGYDKAQPLIVWKEKNILIDGHTRLLTAKTARTVEYIPVIEKSFASEEDALDYVYKLQFARRSITDGELVQLAKIALAKYQKKYGAGGKPEYLAGKFIGLSIGKASKVIAVLDNATEAQIEDIREENTTLNALYENLKRVRTNPFEEDKKSPIKTPKKESGRKEKALTDTEEIPPADAAEETLTDMETAGEYAAGEEKSLPDEIEETAVEETAVEETAVEETESIESDGADESHIKLTAVTSESKPKLVHLEDNTIYIDGEPAVIFTNREILNLLGGRVLSLITIYCGGND